MESDIAAKVGEQFTFTSVPRGKWDGRIHCEVKEVIEGKQLSYTWNANDIGADTVVTFQLDKEGEGTRLTLTHTGFEGAMPGAEGRHAAGWTVAMKSLKTTICGADPAYDWSAFQITFHVEAQIADVFTLWSTAEGMQSFWPDEITCASHDGTIRSPESTFRHGDRIALTFPTRGSTEIEILNIEENKFVTFRFGEDYGWVNVALSEQDGRTRIVLRQFGLPTDGDAAWEIHANARGWWIFNLMNLKSVVLNQRDLRVREAGATNCLGALYTAGDGSAQPPHDWTRFDVYLYIDAPAEDILSRWRTAGGIESFFVGDARFRDASDTDRSAGAKIEAGDTYEWRAIHGFLMKGKVLGSTADKVSFTFGGRYEVEVTATPHGSGTLLHLHQRGMADEPDDRVNGSLNCRSCWIYFLTTLKSQAEGGIDLRDRNPETAGKTFQRPFSLIGDPSSWEPNLPEPFPSFAEGLRTSLLPRIAL
jgi:uncharacterized protein YndB with AHSA1/START domain